MKGAHGRAASLAVLLLAVLGFTPSPAPEAALAEGNLLFEKGEVEAAFEAYSRGWMGSGAWRDTADIALAGILAYDAGTCALRLGRLPEALLWYRRAEAAIPGDPWLRDNLAVARHALGETPDELLPESWPRGRLWLPWIGVALAWTALLVILLRPRFPGGTVALLALLAGAAFASGPLLDRFGPRAAVLLASCGGLPAGSEIRVRAVDGGAWRIVGERSNPRCPRESIGLVRP
jgi:tetratricopeptide (TPR) repeat protein